MRLGRAGWLVAASLAFGAFGTPHAAVADEQGTTPTPSKRAWLGVDLGKGAAGGVVVKHVINNSPASKAGVADGDQVVEVDGDAIDEPSQLVARVALAGPTGSLALKVRRGGVEKTVNATLVPHPGQDQILRLDKIGTFAPWKPVTAVSGSVPANLAAMRGKVVVIDFWASWCGACRLLSPHLTKLHTTYASQGLQVIGLTTDEVAVASKAATKLGMTFAVASDANETAMAAFGVKVLPTLFVLDKKGVIREVMTGFDSNKPVELEKLLKKLLAEPAPPVGAQAATVAPVTSSAPVAVAPASTSQAPVLRPSGSDSSK